MLELHDEHALICQQLPRMSSLGLVAGGSAMWLDLLELYIVELR